MDYDIILKAFAPLIAEWFRGILKGDDINKPKGSKKTDI